MIRLLLFLLAFSTTLTAQCCCEPRDYIFYLKVGSGVSVAQSAAVVAPSPPWYEAVQGYDSGLGNCGIVAFSVGCEFVRLVDLEVGVSNRSTFKYRKFQTPVAGGASYTREFDLDVTPILFSANFLGRYVKCLSWDVSCGTFYPFLGFGLGISNVLITNYRTTGLAPTGDSAPYASFSSENEYTLRKNFTYTVQFGGEYSYNDYWAIATGYRWLDAGHFKGPRYQRVATGSAVDVSGDEWNMRFKANEWFVELKIFI